MSEIGEIFAALWGDLWEKERMNIRDETTERPKVPREVLRLTLYETDEGLGFSSFHLETVTWETERRPLVLVEAFKQFRALIESDPSTREGRPIVPPPLDFEP